VDSKRSLAVESADSARGRQEPTTAAREPGFAVRRLGIIAEPEPGNPAEAWGILNPGAARGRDGQLYLFPRVVAEGNFSRIAIARVRFDAAGVPAGIERLGYALEPTESYEQNPKSGGGCEDARVTYLQPLDLYVMAYTAYTLLGPRIALAISKDLLRWERLGLLRFAPACPVDFNDYGNKDGLFFPDVLTDEHGRQTLALIHRPTYHIAQADGTVMTVVPPGIRERRQSLWMSHTSLERVQHDPQALTWIEDTHLLAVPEQDWEQVKIGGGAPPVRTPFGWLLVYHGVAGAYMEGAFEQSQLRYAAGLMVLDSTSGRKILYRSREPVLTPDFAAEREGTVPNVVFPTGLDQRPDAADPEGFDLYYGMADTRIGVARLELPPMLPTEAL
jgi:beta-1,2-mannobiose phosphorylase / 1,2-beta-oligomannan phosphorylase